MPESNGGNEFYAALKKAAKNVVNTDIYPIQYPSQGDFIWRYQNINQVFNRGTFKYISARVSPGEIQGSAKISNEGSFPNAYSEIVESLYYALCNSKLNELNDAKTKASIQGDTVVTDYQDKIGNITEDQWKPYGSKLDYIIGYVLGTKWCKEGTTVTYSDMANNRNLISLFPNRHPSGDSVITDVSVYLQKMQSVLALLDLRQNNAWIVSQLKNNTTMPSNQNSGMQMFDPIDGSKPNIYQVGYEINTSVAEISNKLSNDNSAISMSIKTSKSAENTMSVNIEGQASFTVGSWLSLTTEASSQYDLSKVSGSSMDTSINMTWKGCTMVPISPRAWQQATNQGWYYPEIIAQAVNNGDKDVDGFKFSVKPAYKMDTIENGGNFGLLSGLLISKYPTIRITYKNADYNSFKQSFGENISGNLTLFGAIKLGSLKQGAFISKLEKGAHDDTFTLEFSPSDEVVTIPEYQKTAYVIGCTVSNSCVVLNK